MDGRLVRQGVKWRAWHVDQWGWIKGTRALLAFQRPAAGESANGAPEKVAGIDAPDFVWRFFFALGFSQGRGARCVQTLFVFVYCLVNARRGSPISRP